MNDKSLFFVTLSLCCVWVILDNIYGKKYLDIFLSNVFDFYGDSETSNENKENLTKAVDAITNHTKEEKQEIYNRIDEDKDGKVSNKEFFKTMPTFKEYLDFLKGTGTGLKNFIFGGNK